jgi:hypothetical protein
MSTKEDPTGHDSQQQQQPQPSSGNGSGQGSASAYERMRSQRDNRAKESPHENGSSGGRSSSGIS